jgi:hypothetical protein
LSRRNSFYRTGGTNGHKRRRFDFAVCRRQYAAPRRTVFVLMYDFEITHFGICL